MTTKRFFAACAALSILAVAGAAHATVTPITSADASYDANPDYTYNLDPYDVMPGKTSSATDTQNVKPGSSTYDFAFSVDQSYGTTAFGSFGFDKGGNALSDANLQLYSGTPMDPTNFITGVDYDPGTDPQQSLQAQLNQGTYFVQVEVKNPVDGGRSSPITFSATVTRPVSAAPEPSTWLLMMAGVGGLGMALRAQRRQKPALSVA